MAEDALRPGDRVVCVADVGGRHPWLIGREGTIVRSDAFGSKWEVRWDGNIERWAFHNEVAPAPTTPPIVFAVTGFEGHWPVGTAAIVYAHNREECKRVLRDELRKQSLGTDDPDEWTISPLTPIRDDKAAAAHILLNGDY